MIMLEILQNSFVLLNLSKLPNSTKWRSFHVVYQN